MQLNVFVCALPVASGAGMQDKNMVVSSLQLLHAGKRARTAQNSRKQNSTVTQERLVSGYRCDGYDA